MKDDTEHEDPRIPHILAINVRWLPFALCLCAAVASKAVDIRSELNGAKGRTFFGMPPPPTVSRLVFDCSQVNGHISKGTVTGMNETLTG